MRSFEQRIAEIHRRSEEILKKRRQRRKYLLTACIPLAVCIGLYGAFALPEMMAANSAAMDGETVTQVAGSLSNGGIYSTGMTVESVTVSGTGASKSITESAQVQQICDQLYACYWSLELTESVTANGSVEDGAENVFPNEATEEDFSNIGSTAIVDSATAEYTVTLTLQDGSTAEYCLAGNILWNRNTGESCTLKRDQLIQLKDLLGIPHS